MQMAPDMNIQSHEINLEDMTQVILQMIEKKGGA